MRHKQPEERKVKNEFWWAVIYLGRPVAFFPRYREAFLQVKKSNEWFRRNSSSCKYSIQRYRFNFNGIEVDTYKHLFVRVEEKKCDTK